MKFIIWIESTKIIFFCFLASIMSGQVVLPEIIYQDWDSLIKEGGTWQTKDNAAPYDAWEMKFDWGIDKTSMVATLYPLKNGEALKAVWEYRIFYHPMDKLIILEQWGSGGSYGKGTLEVFGNGQSENVSVVYWDSESKVEVKHIQRLEGDVKYSDVYHKDQNNQWILRNKYKWLRIN